MRNVLRLDLVGHGTTEATRRARFPLDEPLTGPGRAAIVSAARSAGMPVDHAPDPSAFPETVGRSDRAPAADGAPVDHAPEPAASPGSPGREDRATTAVGMGGGVIGKVGREGPAMSPASGGRRVTGALGRTAARVLVGPELRTRETATLMGLSATPDPRLRDLDAGRWGGAELTAVPQTELHAWLTDPEFRGHGGESVAQVIERVRYWMAEIAAEGLSTVAVTHPAVIRAALLVTLDAPPASFWRIDIPPGAVTRLRHRGRWSLVFSA